MNDIPTTADFIDVSKWDITLQYIEGNVDWYRGYVNGVPVTVMRTTPKILPDLRPKAFKYTLKIDDNIVSTEFTTLSKLYEVVKDTVDTRFKQMFLNKLFKAYGYPKHTTKT